MSEFAKPWRKTPGLLRGRSRFSLGVCLALSLVAGMLVLAPPAAAAACTPTSSIDGTATVLQFSTVATCDWTVPANVLSADVMVLAGGGGGNNAGGGAGGLIYQSAATGRPSG